MQGLLQLQAHLFDTSSVSYVLWQSMMQFANIGMIVILIVIIISQLTGYGIDNYGIKKMLPKLIIGAVLVNLSFFLCEIAIDVSNIFGKQFVVFSRQLARDARAEVSSGFGDVSAAGLGTILMTLFGAASGAAVVLPTATTVALAGTGVTISLGAISAPLWVIPLIFVGLIILISILVFFLMIAARRLLAVLLVAICPLAIVCYVLPNTQKLWKRWWELFKAILLVYPICGALYGASRLMKVIAFNTGSMHVGMVMVALLMTFAPLAAAPILLKKALSAFGEFGGLVTRIGERAKSGVRSAQGMVKDSAVYRDALRDARIKNAERNIDAAKAVRSGNATRRQRWLYRMAGGDKGYTKNLARNQAIVERGLSEDVEEARMVMRDETGSYNTDVMFKQFNDLLDKAEVGDLTSDEQNKAQALMSQLAVSQGGGKLLFSSMMKHSDPNDDNSPLVPRSGNAAMLMGNYLSRDSRFAKALSDKSMRTEQRLSDIAAGVVNANITQEQYDGLNYEFLKDRRMKKASGEEMNLNENIKDQENQWKSQWSAQHPGKQLDDTTVIENIARNVLDKDKDFVLQSGSEVNELLKHLSQDRIDKMARNSTLFGYGDVADGVEKAIKARASRTYVDKDENEVQIGSIETDADNNVVGYNINTDPKSEAPKWQKVKREDAKFGDYQLKETYEQKSKPVGRPIVVRLGSNPNTFEVRQRSDGKYYDKDGKVHNLDSPFYEILNQVSPSEDLREGENIDLRDRRR